MPHHLPANPYAAGSSHSAAYITCLSMEGSALDAPDPQSGPPTLVCARLLGYMLIHAPVPTGRDNVANEISSCADNSQLRQLASLYINNFLRCFKAAKGQTPLTSDHPSRPSFENAQDTFKYIMEEAPAGHSTAKKKALIRDGFRCVVSGVCDLASVKNNVPGAAEALATNPTGGMLGTELAHILPPSTNQGSGPELEDSDKLQRRYAAGALTVMERFGLVNGLELNGTDMHRLENVMTMGRGVHAAFDTLDLWFEATPIVHTYTLRATHPAILNPFPATVTFTSPSPLLPLPDPRYLALHAACARVAHLSGAGEYIEEMYRRLEDTKVLASNGSSFDTLSFALEKMSTTTA